MKNRDGIALALDHLITSGRIVFASMAVCCILYGVFVLAFAQLAVPHRAEGLLVRNAHGEIIGSELIAQGFSRPEYFWSRPSAVAYNASAAGGSNLSPASPWLRNRAETIINKIGVANGKPIPADLVTTSGSGLDPHITLSAAKYQVERVARARNLSVDDIMTIVQNHMYRPGGPFTSEPVVNVLLVNTGLDRTGK